LRAAGLPRWSATFSQNPAFHKFHAEREKVLARTVMSSNENWPLLKSAQS
jgi:hypothetical protein